MNDPVTNDAMPDMVHNIDDTSAANDSMDMIRMSVQQALGSIQGSGDSSKPASSTMPQTSLWQPSKIDISSGD